MTIVTADNVLDLFACDYLYHLAAGVQDQVPENSVLVGMACDWIRGHDGYEVSPRDAAEILNAFRDVP